MDAMVGVSADEKEGKYQSIQQERYENKLTCHTSSLKKLGGTGFLALRQGFCPIARSGLRAPVRGPKASKIPPGTAK